MTDQPKPEEFRVPVKLFDLGQIVATPGALAACSREYMAQCLAVALAGAATGALIDAEDHKANFDAIFLGNRILSAYPIDPAKPCEGLGANTLWIITGARPQRDHVPFAERVLTTLPVFQCGPEPGRAFFAPRGKPRRRPRPPSSASHLGFQIRKGAFRRPCRPARPRRLTFPESRNAAAFQGLCDLIRIQPDHLVFLRR